MNKSNARLLYSALAVGAIVGSFFSPFISVANGLSPMVNSNEPDVNRNMSKPQLHVGMVTMPVACTSLDEALGSATGMTGGSSNESQETIMGKMQNMTSTSGLNATDNNLTEAVMQDCCAIMICKITYASITTRMYCTMETIQNAKSRLNAFGRASLLLCLI